MSYTPTEWKAGDVITSAKLNKLEQGVAAGGSGGGVLAVNITWNDQTGVGTADKTAGEIMEAAQSGAVVFVDHTPGDDEYIMTYTLLAAHHEESLYEFEVSGEITFSATSATDYPVFGG